MTWHRLVIKDAARQLIWRLISALFGFLVIKIMTPYLGPLRYWDYSTILKYFAIRTALADLWLYVLAVRELWAIKEKEPDNKEKLESTYGKFVWTRLTIMWAIYVIAIVIAYLLPAYTSNPYIIRGLPFGMIFSASFMFAGIQQLPLQLFRRMDQLSFSLITARLSQIAILVPVVYIFFKNVDFNGSSISILAFCLILFSVVASAVWQNIEIHLRSKKLLPLHIKFDRKFTKDIIVRNRQYWVSYYLSSFHTLIVLLFLWRFFPTAWGNDYSWIRALSLSLIEILLIVPSSLGNSLLHKISSYTTENKRKSMWNLLILIYRIWWIVAMNFRIFSDWIIKFVAWKQFLWTFWLMRDRGSNQILPFLGLVLRGSFVKQVYNYLFVAVDRQNVLLPNNLIWVLVWIPVAIWTIPKYGLVWWVITQTLIELIFMVGAIFIARRIKLYPLFEKKRIFILTAIIAVFTVIAYFADQFLVTNRRNLFAVWLAVNWLLIYISLPYIKKVARGLTFEEVAVIVPEE